MLHSRAMLVLLACAVGCAPVASRPAPETPVILSPLALRMDQVRRLRELADGLQQGDPRASPAREALAVSLLDLGEQHRLRAVELDPSAAALPVPVDQHPPRPQGAGEEGNDAPVPPEPPRPLVRSGSAWVALAPAARAHILAQDACLLEAAELLRFADGSALHVRRARALTAIGQLTEAQNDWALVLRNPPDAASAVEGYLVFVDRFGGEGDGAHVTAALDKAGEMAGGDARLLASVCERAHRWSGTTRYCAP